MKIQTIYITYDLPQDADKARLVPGVKKWETPGQLVRHEIGEFSIDSGRKIPGVRLTISDAEEEDVEKHVIELPSLVQNVEVHVNRLPEKYREALKSAA
jgi:hypothetical protein